MDDVYGTPVGGMDDHYPHLRSGDQQHQDRQFVLRDKGRQRPWRRR